MASPYKIPTFTPSWEDFQVFNRFVCRASESFGKNMPGVIRVIPHKEWQGLTRDSYMRENLKNYVIETPFKQSLIGKPGNYILRFLNGSLF